MWDANVWVWFFNVHLKLVTWLRFFSTHLLGTGGSYCVILNTLGVENVALCEHL